MLTSGVTVYDLSFKVVLFNVGSPLVLPGDALVPDLIVE